ncbi:unnamed protein product [Toxocara canis]|uniref:Uncharacterized protein n=1 Tax=Toxocara canis TaxID=6265 RepID=A0A183UWM3_TOXCA|nr:unnamed protein product [Toxocara canis]
MIVSESIQPLTPHIVEASKLRCRTLENGGSEMLEVVKDTVTVTSIPGGILQYAVTANFRLVDAFWCDFPAGNPAATDDDLFGSCICLIGKQVIQFCPREGSQIYAITLPFPVSKVLPSPLGLIMEKERTPKSASITGVVVDEEELLEANLVKKNCLKRLWRRGTARSAFGEEELLEAPLVKRN